MRDRETIDSELRLLAALRHAARERSGPLPSIDLADALQDERRKLIELGYKPRPEYSQFPIVTAKPQTDLRRDGGCRARRTAWRSRDRFS
jgi:hypothetical protein